jgi:uncharacterized protein
MLEHDVPDATREGLERFRALRRELEAAVLPRASSLDGRAFSFQASLHGLALRVGGYVVIEDGGAPRLGEVLTLHEARHAAGEMDVAAAGAGGGAQLRASVPVSHAAGEGTLLEGDGTPFHDAALRVATPDEVAAWLGRARRPGGLAIGELRLAPGVPATLDPRGFDRHTFLCGQSGSGKTHALGVVLEQLLARTRLRIVVLDPNSDFVRMADLRPGTNGEDAGKYARAAGSIAVHSAGASDGRRLRLRLADVEPETQAALLRLDPVADREEHAELVELLSTGGVPSLEALEQSGRPEARRLVLRARNLGVPGWGLWAREEAGSVLDAVTDTSARCVVVDLGSLGTREEQALVSAAVLGELWRRREQRDPVLVVIDEAHNVCPAAPQDALTAVATDYAVRIAAEGRKFGLYLLLSTQRPQKVPENVISQCDNLVLMRLNSLADVRYAETVFSFVPPSLVALAGGFRQGESLVAGKLSPQPTLVRFGARLSQEGGADVPATWADAHDSG